MRFVEVDGKKVLVGPARLGPAPNGEGDEPIVCPVCGKYAFAEHDNYDVCPFCGWENDEVQSLTEDDGGAPNHVSVLDARVNYKKFGAKNEESLPLVKALQEQLKKGVQVQNATMCMHVDEFVKDADGAQMIKNW